MMLKWVTTSCGNLLAIAPFSPNTYVLILIGQVNTVVEIKGHHSACCVVAEKPLNDKNTSRIRYTSLRCSSR